MKEGMKRWDCDLFLKPAGGLSVALEARDRVAAEIAARVWAAKNGYGRDIVKRVVCRPAGEKVGPNGEGWG